MQLFTASEYKNCPKDGIKQLRECFEAFFVELQLNHGDFPKGNFPNRKMSKKPQVIDFDKSFDRSSKASELIEGELQSKDSNNSPPLDSVSSKFTKSGWKKLVRLFGSLLPTVLLANKSILNLQDKRCKKLDGMREKREFEEATSVAGWTEQNEYSALVSELEMLQKEVAAAETLLEIAREWIERPS